MEFIIVHPPSPHEFACLVAFGNNWRSEPRLPQSDLLYIRDTWHGTGCGQMVGILQDPREAITDEDYPVLVVEK